MKTPSFSVIIPCYNSSSTIVDTIASAARQSVEDIEIIVINDGSTDDGPQKVASLTAAEPRLRIVSQPNAGLAGARNRGIAESRGEFLAFLDADDLWDPCYLETHARRFKENASLGLSFSVVQFMRANGEPTGQTSRPKLCNLTAAEFLAANPCTCGSSIVVRRTVVQESGPFDTNFRRGEDQEWLFRVALTGWKIEGDPIPLVSYRQTEGSLSSNLPAMYEAYVQLLSKARSLQPELVQRHEKIASARTLRYLARRALRAERGQAQARHYVMRALASGPGIVLQEPKQTLATLAAAFIPGCNLLFNAFRAA